MGRCLRLSLDRPRSPRDTHDEVGFGYSSPTGRRGGSKYVAGP